MIIMMLHLLSSLHLIVSCKLVFCQYQPASLRVLMCLLMSIEADLQSLFEFAELHDKDLEEAQEHRRKCEMEERNALNAYRRAQRALLEANARCTYLYRKREIYSTQLHSFLMEDPSILYSYGHLQEAEERWNLTNNVSEVDLDIIPTSHQLEDFEAGNRLGYDSNVQNPYDDAHNRSSVNEDGHNLGSEACSEPDASSSELVRGNRFSANGRIHSPSVISMYLQMMIMRIFLWIIDLPMTV